MTENKVALKNMTEEELKEFLKSIGEKPFRGTQIFSWIYKGAKTFDDMNNIPKSLREKLEKVSYIGNSQLQIKFPMIFFYKLAYSTMRLNFPQGSA